MDKFEMLNSRTHEFRNNIAIDPMKQNTTCGSALFAKKNEETFKANNGRYWWERG